MYMALTSTKLLGTNEINGTIIVPHILVQKLIEHSCVYVLFDPLPNTHFLKARVFFFFLRYLSFYMNFQNSCFLSFLNFYQIVNETCMKMFLHQEKTPAFAIMSSIFLIIIFNWKLQTQLENVFLGTRNHPS
jgi:hypothetical protein